MVVKKEDMLNHLRRYLPRSSNVISEFDDEEKRLIDELYSEKYSNPTKEQEEELFQKYRKNVHMLVACVLHPHLSKDFKSRVIHTQGMYADIYKAMLSAHNTSCLDEDVIDYCIKRLKLDSPSLRQIIETLHSSGGDSGVFNQVALNAMVSHVLQSIERYELPPTHIVNLITYANTEEHIEIINKLLADPLVQEDAEFCHAVAVASKLDASTRDEAFNMFSDVSEFSRMEELTPHMVEDVYRANVDIATKNDAIFDGQKVDTLTEMECRSTIRKLIQANMLPVSKQLDLIERCSENKIATNITIVANLMIHTRDEGVMSQWERFSNLRIPAALYVSDYAPEYMKEKALSVLMDKYVETVKDYTKSNDKCYYDEALLLAHQEGKLTEQQYNEILSVNYGLDSAMGIVSAFLGYLASENPNEHSIKAIEAMDDHPAQLFQEMIKEAKAQNFNAEEIEALHSLAVDKTMPVQDIDKIDVAKLCAFIMGWYRDVMHQSKTAEEGKYPQAYINCIKRMRDAIESYIETGRYALDMGVQVFRNKIKPTNYTALFRFQIYQIIDAHEENFRDALQKIYNAEQTLNYEKAKVWSDKLHSDNEKMLNDRLWGDEHEY